MKKRLGFFSLSVVLVLMFQQSLVAQTTRYVTPRMYADGPVFVGPPTYVSPPFYVNPPIYVSPPVYVNPPIYVSPPVYSSLPWPNYTNTTPVYTSTQYWHEGYLYRSELTGWQWQRKEGHWCGNPNRH